MPDNPPVQPWELAPGQRVLAFSDMHQDVAWATAILEREQSNYDHIVFMGDFIDSHRSETEVAGAEKTARFIKQLIDGAYGPATLLLGNHDLPVFEGWRDCANHRTPRVRNICSGYSSSSSKKVNHILSWADWRRFELFKLVNGRLISHAGFLGDYWVPEDSVAGNLAALYRESQDALEQVAFKGSRFWRVGSCRGGVSEWGGPVWNDFLAEFIDELPVPQLVGHTHSHDKDKPVRQRGTSFCIDGGQRTYALIAPDGALTFKALVQTAVSGTWVEEPVVPAILPASSRHLLINP